MLAIAGRTLVLWPLIPALWLARLLAGQRLYDALASRRMILIPGPCADHCAPAAAAGAGGPKAGAAG
jgi:hypothetical protein